MLIAQLFPLSKMGLFKHLKNLKKNFWHKSYFLLFWLLQSIVCLEFSWQNKVLIVKTSTKITEQD